MTPVICDMCKKVIHDAEKDVNYYAIKHLEVCHTCMKQFDRDVEDILDEVSHYSFDKSRSVYWNELVKATK